MVRNGLFFQKKKRKKKNGLKFEFKRIFCFAGCVVICYFLDFCDFIFLWIKLFNQQHFDLDAADL